MSKASEGVRRLSIFAGGVGAFLWFGFGFIVSVAFTEMGGVADWAFFVGGLPVSFLILFVLVRGAAWVVSGFTDKQE